MGAIHGDAFEDKDEYTPIKPSPTTNNSNLSNMTDNLRQGAGDKLASNLKPDSEKSTLEKGQDQVKVTADSLAGQAQPEDQKSYTQQATDAISNAGQQVSDTLGLSGERSKKVVRRILPLPIGKLSFRNRERENL